MKPFLARTSAGDVNLSQVVRTERLGDGRLKVWFANGLDMLLSGGDVAAFERAAETVRVAWSDDDWSSETRVTLAPGRYDALGRPPGSDVLPREQGNQSLQPGPLLAGGDVPATLTNAHTGETTEVSLPAEAARRLFGQPEVLPRSCPSGIPAEDCDPRNYE